MTSFRFIPVTRHPVLAPFVSRIHAVESGGRLPAGDRKLIVPNANFKLTLTWRNGIMADIGGKTFIQTENKLSLAGIIHTPVTLDSKEDAQTGTIIIEFNPLGVYRLFPLSFATLENQIVNLDDLIGPCAVELQKQLAEQDSVDLKLHMLQNFLIRRLDKADPDPVYDYCVRQIYESRGLITVAALEKKTGYSARWLHRKFSEHLGTGPKNFSEIIRFKHFYQAYSTGFKFQNPRDYLYDYYYDQSHFLRAFKRFTGFTPTELQNSLNELATMHYIS